MECGRSLGGLHGRGFQDLVRLLEQGPEWRTELRRLVLTEELLGLPALVGELAEVLRWTEAEVVGLR